MTNHDEEMKALGGKVIRTLAAYLYAATEFEALVAEVRKTDPKTADEYVTALQMAVQNA